MDSHPPEVKNFFVSVRNCLISRNKDDNIQSLIAIIDAWDNIANDERQSLMKELINLDFVTHYQRLIISNEVMMKLTLKITLCLMENDKIFKDYFLDLLKAHFRSFLFMAREGQTNVGLIVDAVTFIQIMQKR